MIDAWSKADKEYSSAEHAEAVLDKMETYFLNEKSDRDYMLSNVAYNLSEFAVLRQGFDNTSTHHTFVHYNL